LSIIIKSPCQCIYFLLSIIIKSPYQCIYFLNPVTVGRSRSWSGAEQGLEDGV